MASRTTRVLLGILTALPLAAAAPDAAADTCAGTTPEATWRSYLKASRSLSPSGACRCMTREVQVERATHGTVAAGMIGATLDLTSGHVPPEQAAAAGTLRAELDALFARHGLSAVMEESAAALRELAWDGDPELVDERTESQISAAVAKTDPMALLEDLERFGKQRLAGSFSADEETPAAGGLATPELQGVELQQDVAHGTAGGERLRFRRIGDLWYLDSDPLYW